MPGCSPRTVRAQVPTASAARLPPPALLAPASCSPQPPRLPAPRAASPHPTAPSCPLQVPRCYAPVAVISTASLSASASATSASSSASCAAAACRRTAACRRAATSVAPVSYRTLPAATAASSPVCLTLCRARNSRSAAGLARSESRLPPIDLRCSDRWPILRVSASLSCCSVVCLSRTSVPPESEPSIGACSMSLQKACIERTDELTKGVLQRTTRPGAADNSSPTAVPLPPTAAAAAAGVAAGSASSVGSGG
eukprot:scaffold31867_cov50-Phaeocystis_antarctica.AAC.4